MSEYLAPKLHPIDNDTQTLPPSRDADEAIGTQTITVSGVITLTPPANTETVQFSSTGPVRYTADGTTTPTADVGTLVISGNTVVSDGNNLKFAAAEPTATAPVLTVYYYNF